MDICRIIVGFALLGGCCILRAPANETPAEETEIIEDYGGGGRLPFWYCAPNVVTQDQPEPSLMPELASPFFPAARPAALITASLQDSPLDEPEVEVFITAPADGVHAEATATHEAAVASSLSPANEPKPEVNAILIESSSILTAPTAPTAPVAPVARGGMMVAGSLPPVLGQAKGDPGSFSLSIAEAVLQSLSNNIELRSAQLLPQISANAVQTARAVFDPTLSLAAARTLYNRDHTSGAAGTVGGVTQSTADSFNAGIAQFAPTGTTVALDAGVSDRFSKTQSMTGSTTQGWDGEAGLNISQSLLRGFGLAVNLVSIRQARLDLDISYYQLQNFTESLIENVENTYWNLVLGGKEIEILQDALRIAQQQMRNTEDMIRIGTLSRTDLPEARATVADRHVALIEAHNRYEQYRLQMLWLLNPSGEDKWTSALALDAMPGAPAVRLDPVEDHVRLALAKRPDVNQARLRLRRGELTVVRTRNGLLPELDFIVSANGGGGNFYNTSHAYFGNDNFALSAGLSFNYDLGNRAARAAYDSSNLNVEQLRLAMENLRQQIQVEVRSAYLDVQRYQKQIEATGLAREQYAESLRAEQEKFKAQRSTNIAVAIAQNNYLNSRLQEARAVIYTIKSLTALYRYDGSLLARRGVVLPGH